jgi:hydroxylaminobenzene mutase
MALKRSIQQGHRLLQIGVSLFLVALLVGLAVPRFAVPRLGLSAHLLGIMQGLFLMVIGLLWPKLSLSPRLFSMAFWLAIYGCLAPLMANMLAAIWGAGNTLLPMAAGLAHGSAFQEATIAVALRTGGASLIAASSVVLWGLRLSPVETVAP